MKLVTTTERLDLRFGEEGAIRIIGEAGFDGYDYSMFRSLADEKNIMNSDEYMVHIKNLRALADSIGIECRQAHAPFPVSKQEEEYDKITFKRIVRSIEAASYLGAKTIVVHPISSLLPYYLHREELFEQNMKFFKKLIPYAEKGNIKIAIENMYSNGKYYGIKTDGVCSHADEICRYIDSLDSHYITFCLDTGHAALSGEEPGDLALQAGKRIGAIHVSDNNFSLDDHTLPYAGSIDWSGFAFALAKVGYQGDFTFEVATFFDGMEDGLILPSLRYMNELGRYMISMIEKYKSYNEVC